MSKVQIFKSYEEFLQREDKSINGVSQEYLDYNNLTLETLNLINCEQCWNCYECENCWRGYSLTRVKNYTLPDHYL